MNLMKHIINRRKFLSLFSASCCGLFLPSCTTVPITERKQLALFSEGVNSINVFCCFNSASLLMMCSFSIEFTNDIYCGFRANRRT